MKSKRDIRLSSSILVILVLLLSAGLVSAQGNDPTDDDVNAVAKQLYCPVCENIPLDACGTAACEQWRGIIRDKLAEGLSEDEIKEYFVAQYGDRVLAEPPRRGFNWLVYIVPGLVFLGGGWLLYTGYRSWQSAGSAAAPGKQSKSETKPDEDPYISRIEDELRKRSGGSK